MNARLLLSLAAAVCFPLAAAAQSADPGGGVNVDLDGPGGGVHVGIHDTGDTGRAAVHVHGGAHQEINVDRPGEAYRLTYDTDRRGRTLFKVLAPEGLHVRVTEGRRVIVRDTIPVSFHARDGHYYRVRIFGPGGKVFDKKLEARGGLMARLWVRAGAPGTARVHVGAGGTQVDVGGGAVATTTAGVSVTVGATPPAPPPAPAPAPAPPPAAAPPPPAPATGCLGDADLASLKQAIGAEDFSDGKLTVLGDFARTHAFCVDQVVTVLGTLDFSEGKLEALRMMKPHIVDPENDYRIYQAFEFDGDKAKARRILGH